eukprot:2941256-Lingulodinium_polyedra.AAC.1
MSAGQPLQAATIARTGLPTARWSAVSRGVPQERPAFPHRAFRVAGPVSSSPRAGVGRVPRL